MLVEVLFFTQKIKTTGLGVAIIQLRYRNRRSEGMKNIDVLANCLEYIEGHLKENIKTPDIAKACCLSKSSLEKMFQYVYHLSVHGYIIRRRMMLAARMLSEHQEISILTVAVECGYSSHEAFTRAFKEIWNCNPSEFRNRKYSELFPRYREPIQEGDRYIMQRRNVDISQLYDLFCERRNCYFVCCDIKSLVPINEISFKAGDLAILESMKRMENAAGEDDIVFRIGGDEFCILTNSEEKEYAEKIVDSIIAKNGETFAYEEQQIPLNLYAISTKFEGNQMKYNDLFTQLHMSIRESKPM